MPRETLSSLRLEDYSDRELLHIVAECCERSKDGYTSSAQIATALGIKGDYPARPVGSRLGALRRFGVVEKDVESTLGRWRLTKLGRDVAFGGPPKELLGQVKSAKSSDVVLLTRALAQRHTRVADGAGRLMNREWRRAWMT